MAVGGLAGETPTPEEGDARRTGEAAAPLVAALIGPGPGNAGRTAPFRAAPVVRPPKD